MTMGTFGFSIEALIVGSLGMVWLLSLIVAITVRRADRTPKGYRLRRTDVLALVLSLAFGATWSVSLLLDQESGGASNSPPVRSCVLIEPGASEKDVRDALGKPDEIRPADDLRGPGNDLWIYRDQRCVVHYLDGNVISIE